VVRRTWRLIERAPVECPADFPRRFSLCDGQGDCSYVVNAGCDSIVAEVYCGCLDASWLWQIYQVPEPCDCSAITTRALCELYPSDCAWSQEGTLCEGLGG